MCQSKAHKKNCDFNKVQNFSNSIYCCPWGQNWIPVHNIKFIWRHEIDKKIAIQNAIQARCYLMLPEQHLGSFWCVFSFLHQSVPSGSCCGISHSRVAQPQVPNHARCPGTHEPGKAVPFAGLTTVAFPSYFQPVNAMRVILQGGRTWSESCMDGFLVRVREGAAANHVVINFMLYLMVVPGKIGMKMWCLSCHGWWWVGEGL